MPAISLARALMGFSTDPPFMPVSQAAIHGDFLLGFQACDYEVQQSLSASMPVSQAAVNDEALALCDIVSSNPNPGQGAVTIQGNYLLMPCYER